MENQYTKILGKVQERNLERKPKKSDTLEQWFEKIAKNRQENVGTRTKDQEQLKRKKKSI